MIKVQNIRENDEFLQDFSIVVGNYYEVLIEKLFMILSFSES